MKWDAQTYGTVQAPQVEELRTVHGTGPGPGDSSRPAESIERQFPGRGNDRKDRAMNIKNKAHTASADGRRTRVIIALFALYTTWSTTYLAIKIALVSFPPFFLAGLRYFLVGVVLFLSLRFAGHPAPDRRQWAGAAAVGGLLLFAGNGLVTYAQQWVSTGIAALVVGSTPIWTVLFSGIWNEWPRRLEWAGLAVAFAGLLLLNLGGELSAYPAAAAALVVAVAAWSFGSAWSRRLSLPPGLMAGAAQMLAGGALLLAAGLLAGERMPGAPSARSIAALLYLSVFGSLVGYSAYVYLLKNVRASLATSYAYVNPVLAVLLGIWLAGERLTGPEVAAMASILSGVLLVLMAQRRTGAEKEARATSFTAENAVNAEKDEKTVYS